MSSAIHLVVDFHIYGFLQPHLIIPSVPWKEEKEAAEGAETQDTFTVCVSIKRHHVFINLIKGSPEYTM